MKKATITKFLLTTGLIAGMIFTISSCSKDNSSSSSTTVTEAQAAEVTTDAVTPSTGGMVSQITGSVGFFSGATVTGGTVSSVNSHAITYSSIACGVAKDSTVAYASVAGAFPSFTYSLSWQNLLTCSAPSTFTTNFNGKGSYNGYTLSSSFTSTGSFVLSGLAAADADYTFNSSYARQGTTTSKVGNKNTFTHSLTITSSNIVYDKSTQLIVSGTAKVAVTVTSTSGKSWVYGGTLTFLGNKTATLVLNSGTVYNISWS